VDSIDYRIVYEIDVQEVGITLLMVGAWESLEQRLEEN
jgi:mRNA-degrading endonuclease RelE of RelBE toxin-antitoxin system